MKPKDYPVEKDNHLPSTSIFGFHVNFARCGYINLLSWFR